MPLVRAAILAFLLLCGALAPQAGWAHGGHGHEAAKPPAAKPAPAALPVAGKVSPLCPPGGNGHVCGCGNLSVCDGRTKSIAIAAFGPRRAAVRPVGRIASLQRATAAARHRFSPASPRAPPAFS
jgi:hypothetical protein